jgi:hypothetical protein
MDDPAGIVPVWPALLMPELPEGTVTVKVSPGFIAATVRVTLLSAVA